MFRPKQCCILVVLVAIAALQIAAQDLREKADTHPLDLAYYLLIKDEFDSDYGVPITRVLFRTGRFDQALAASKVDDEIYDRRGELVWIGLDQAKGGDPDMARRIADKVFDEFIKDDSYPSDHEVAALGELLAATFQPEKLRRVIDKIEPSDRLRLLIRTAAFYASKRQTVSARTLLKEIESLPSNAVDERNRLVLIDLADVNLKIGQKNEAIATLRRLWKLATEADDDRPRMALYRQFYLLGLKQDANEVWKTIDESNSVRMRLYRSAVLLENGERSPAEAILTAVTKEELQQYYGVTGVVEQWLSLGQPKIAEDLADKSSTDPDDYGQQDAYIKIADYYLSKKNRARAKAVLDKAFNRARIIKFEHHPMDSNGASSGTRKRTYLHNIRERLEKLGDVRRALETVQAIDDPHQMAKETLAAGLARFARDNARQMPRKEVIDLLNEGQNIARKIDADEVEVQIMADYAETLAKVRDREGASDKLAELLESRKGKYLEGYAILLSGEVFEKYKLPLTDRLRRAMTAILDEHEA